MWFKLKTIYLVNIAGNSATENLFMPASGTDWPPHRAIECRKQTLLPALQIGASRPGLPSLISLMVSVDVKHHVYLAWIQGTCTGNEPINTCFHLPGTAHQKPISLLGLRSAAASFANIQHRGQFDRKLLQQRFWSIHTSSSKMKIIFVRRASYRSMCPATDRRNQPWWTRHDRPQSLPTTFEVGLVCWMMASQVHRFADMMRLFLARAYRWVTLSVYLGECDCFKLNQK